MKRGEWTRLPLGGTAVELASRAVDDVIERAVITGVISH